MYNQRLQTIGFFVLFGLATLVAILLFWPFLQLLALAAILAVLFKPWHRYVQSNFKSKGLSAFVTVLFVLIIVLIPLGLIGYVLYSEFANLYSNVTSGAVSLDQSTIIDHLPASLHNIGQTFFNDLNSRLSHVAGSTVQSIAGVLSNVANFFIAAFLVFFALFYFLRDGEKLKGLFINIFPLSQLHESKLVDKIEQAISGVVKGSFLVALIQGVVALVGFLIFGVPQPFLWASFTVLAALVPTFGTSLALIPAVLYLLLTGHTGAAIGMVIWGAVAVGSIDNFISPRLIGSRTNLHPLVVLFAVVGGLQLFGVLGFLLGPIVMAIFMALLEIYQTENIK